MVRTMQWTYDSPGAPMCLNFTFPQLIFDIGERGGLTAENDTILTVGTRVFRYPSGQVPDAEATAALEAFTADLAVRAWLDDDNQFFLETLDGSVLTVTSGGPWESWTFHTPDGGMIVCTPDADLAIWGPRE
jgi:hypothetical protein